MDQGIKSRPRYQPFRIDPTGTRHLIVTDQPSPPPDMPEATELWTLSPHPGTRIFATPTLLFAALAQHLAGQGPGFRLYAIGTEPFIWDAAHIGTEAGLTMQEISLHHAGSLARRVHCIHCKTNIEGVTTNIVPCNSCGAPLFVRDHFSRRLRAFMGVRVDAETPGILPPTETLYA
jgi:predicted RNA-binding Zn-ribbon protein involved in translation (DUF1610 family)